MSIAGCPFPLALSFYFLSLTSLRLGSFQKTFSASLHSSGLIFLSLHHKRVGIYRIVISHCDEMHISLFLLSLFSLVPVFYFYCLI